MIRCKWQRRWGTAGCTTAARSSSAFVVPQAKVRKRVELADDIRFFVGSRLAWYQAPREVVFLDELPLTATGKIIRRALRER